MTSTTKVKVETVLSKLKSLSISGHKDVSTIKCEIHVSLTALVNIPFRAS